MSYHPKSNDKARNQRPAGRSKTPQQPHRAPNDFLDYNHGPDSYGPGQRPPAARRWSSQSDEWKQDQRE